MTIAELVEQYERGRRRTGFALGTQKAYDWGYRRLAAWMAEQGLSTVEELRPEHVEAFQDSLVEAGRARQSQRLAATALRNLFTWAVTRGLPIDDRLHLAVSRVRVPRGQPRPIPPEDLAKLLRYVVPKRPRATLEELRTRAMFLHFIGSAARVSESLQLQRADYERPVVTQKGGSSKLLMAPEIAIEAIADYLAARRDASPWLWVSHDSNHAPHVITPVAVLENWKRLARRVGIPVFTTHQLRHTAATLLLEADVNAIDIAGHLGHVDLSTVATYARVSPRKRQEVLDVLQAALSPAGSELSASDRVAGMESRLDALVKVFSSLLAEDPSRPGRKPALSPHQVAEAERRAAAGETHQAIAADMGVDRSTVGRWMRAPLALPLSPLSEARSPSTNSGISGTRRPDLTEPPELTAEQIPGYLAFLVEHHEALLRTAEELVDRLAAVMPGPSPHQASPVLRVVRGGTAVDPLDPLGPDDWRDDPAATEVRILLHPAKGIRFEVLGDRVGVVQALTEVGDLVAHNGGLGGWLLAD